MVYVITGATGFIGAELVKYILKQGNQVFAICRNINKVLTKLPNHKNLNVLYHDINEYDSLINEIEHADIFINLAWEGISKNSRNESELQRKNIDFVLNVMKIAKKIGCRSFIESGSQAEYGIHNTIITEESKCNPYSEYGKSKLLIKDKAFQFSELINIQYIHLRIFSVYGEEDHPWSLISSCTTKLLKDELVELSTCNQRWNFLYVKDCAKQIYLLSKSLYNNPRIRHEIFNIASEDTRPLKQFIDEMFQLTSSNSKLIFGKIIPQYNLELNPSVSKTKSYTNFISDYSFEEGYKNVINYYKHG